MLKLNLNDETNWKELVSLLLSGQQDEIILKDNDSRSIKMVLEDEPITMKTPETAKRIGIAKGKIVLPPDFDEKFVAMDAEILKSFSTED